MITLFSTCAPARYRPGPLLHGLTAYALLGLLLEAANVGAALLAPRAPFAPVDGKRVIPIFVPRSAKAEPDGSQTARADTPAAPAVLELPSGAGRSGRSLEVVPDRKADILRLAVRMNAPVGFGTPDVDTLLESGVLEAADTCQSLSRRSRDDVFPVNIRQPEHYPVLGRLRARLQIDPGVPVYILFPSRMEDAIWNSGVARIPDASFALVGMTARLDPSRSEGFEVLQIRVQRRKGGV